MSAAVPLSAPLYGASFGQSVGRFFKKYATFSGRASRSEFWWTILFISLVQLVLLMSVIIVGAVVGASAGSDSEAAIFEMISTNPLSITVSILLVVWFFATLVPTFALYARRLHDINLSALWLLLYFVGVGGVFVLISGFIPSNPLGMRFDKPTHPKVEQER